MLFLTFDDQTYLSIFTNISWRRVENIIRNLVHINTSEYLNGLLNILKKTVHHWFLLEAQWSLALYLK